MTSREGKTPKHYFYDVMSSALWCVVFFQAELSLRGHDQHRRKTLGTIFRLDVTYVYVEAFNDSVAPQSSLFSYTGSVYWVSVS